MSRHLREMYLRRNKELARSYLRCWIRVSQLSGALYYNPFCAESCYYWADVLAPISLPTASTLWDYYFPDHCPGSTVFYAAILGEKMCRSYSKCTIRYRPAIVVSCAHWEYGDSARHYVLLERIADVVISEAFVATDYDDILGLVSPTIEEIVYVIRPLDCPCRGLNCEFCSAKTVGKAIRFFSRKIREQLVFHGTKDRIPGYMRRIIHRGRLA